MSEETNAPEANEGSWSGLKKTIIGVVTTAVMGLGTWGVTQITGGDEPAAPAAAPVINITNSNQQAQQASGGGKTVIIKEKETVKEPAKPVKKKEGDEFKEEAPKW